MDKYVTNKKYRGKMILYVMLQFLQTALALLPPYCYLLFLNQIIMEQKFGRLIAIVMLYILVFMGNALFSVLGKMFYNRIFPVMHMEMKEKVL